jgi:hypothetical protein
MDTASGDCWQLDLVPGWKAEVGRHAIVVFHPDGVGALQVSAYQKPSGATVSQQDLLDAPNLPRKHHPQLRKGTWGEFDGFQIAYSEDDTFWRRWWLANGATFLFITYNCGNSETETEMESVNQMMASLRVPRGNPKSSALENTNVK